MVLRREGRNEREGEKGGAAHSKTAKRLLRTGETEIVDDDEPFLQQFVGDGRHMRIKALHEQSSIIKLYIRATAIIGQPSASMHNVLNGLVEYSGDIERSKNPTSPVHPQVPESIHLSNCINIQLSHSADP